MLTTDYSCALQSVSHRHTRHITHTHNPPQAQHCQWHSAGQPNGSHRLGEPEMGLMLSARASRGEQQGEMLIRLQA